MKTKSLEIIKKAFIVWHDGMLDENPHEGFTIETIPITYAESRGQAKRIATTPFNYEVNGDLPKFIDLKVRRARMADEVMFEGTIIIRRQIAIKIKEDARLAERKLKVEKYPDDTLFYIQNGYVGNCISFWGFNSCGYVCDITNAQKYSKAEVLKTFVNKSDENVMASIYQMGQGKQQNLRGLEGIF